MFKLHTQTKTKSKQRRRKNMIQKFVNAAGQYFNREEKSDERRD